MDPRLTDEDPEIPTGQMVWVQVRSRGRWAGYRQAMAIAAAMLNSEHAAVGAIHYETCILARDRTQTCSCKPYMVSVAGLKTR